MDGAPVRILAFRIPKDPTKDRWVPEVISESLHVVHNICPFPTYARGGIVAASYEGVTEISHNSAARQWKSRRVGEGNQLNPKSSRGSSEVRIGELNQYGFIATIEPWHGNEVVVYTGPLNTAKQSSPRYIIDNQLKWGHAVECADVDGDGNDEMIVGIRDNLSDKPGERRGVRIYKALDEKGTKWARNIVEDGGVAVESLAVADLNGDGRPDIVAAGRQTHNIRIYWNEGVKNK